jgi:ectoine hydroxylase-related dioxygenase (phytanoyl-CoA dioxygenase family)
VLHEARQLAGLTQAELADRAGVARSAVSMYESGAREPGADVFLRLLSAAGVAVGSGRPTEGSDAPVAPGLTHAGRPTPMSLRHLPPTCTKEEVAAALRADGACVVDNLVTNALMDRVVEEMEPYIDLTPEGDDDFIGRRTRRTGSLIARSEASRDLIMHPLVLGTTGIILQQATVYQLHLTQVISVFPRETDQPLHRDELAWDFFPFPTDYDIQCNAIWAMTDFTLENGATRVLPGTHTLGPKVTSAEAEIGGDIQRAEMARGSVFFYTGKVYHGAGANNSDKVRQGINITYCVGWVRQEENQYLSTPLEVAKTLDDDLLRLMGYQMGGLAVGYFRDFEDPMAVIRDDMPKRQYDIAGMAKKAAVKGDDPVVSAAEDFYQEPSAPPIASSRSPRRV